MRRIAAFFVAILSVCLFRPALAAANPWNGKVVFQAFWWNCWDTKYPQDWYTYLAKLCPRLREMGFDGIWIPPPSKGSAGIDSNGYDLFDHYDIGQKYQRHGPGGGETTATRFGDMDALLRLIAVAHANGLEVYPDIVLNHCIGGDKDPNAWTDPGLANRNPNPVSEENQKFKVFNYPSFARRGELRGRWPKSAWDFHPSPRHHANEGDDWRLTLVGPDICFGRRCSDTGERNDYMRDNARAWMVWLRRQTGCDGFRFDAVKHYPPEVVEDALFNAMGGDVKYFAVGEFAEANASKLDAWAAATQNRCGTFDFNLRSALADIVEKGGAFDMGSIPNFQQANRLKSVPFVNNHDVWRGAFWDSKNSNSNTDDPNDLDRDGDRRQNGEELGPTINPDDPRADIAYAIALAVDGSPVIYYEDLFVNFGENRFKADPATHPTRDYVRQLVWCHQKLDFKDGAYKVRFQNSPDLLVIERGGKALIGVNDHGTAEQSAWVQTDFGANVELHDYSVSATPNVRTSNDGKVEVKVPPMGHVVLARAGREGGFAPPKRRTIQEFQFADDLGDSHEKSLRYSGRLVKDRFRTAGAVYVAAGTVVKISLYADTDAPVSIRVFKPTPDGKKATDQGTHAGAGLAKPATPALLTFTAAREGYHRLDAKLKSGGPVRGYLKVEYEAPAASQKF